MNNHSHKRCGTLEIICGPMFSGKSEELIRRLRRAKIAKQNVVTFKPSIDDRYTIEMVKSHAGSTIEANAIDDINRLAAQAKSEEIEVVGIDEVQFFPNDIVRIICELVDAGKRVIVAGLDLDFRGVPFGCMPILLAIADEIQKLQAICTVCGDEAHFTQRLVDDEPASYDDPIIMIGAHERYQARCRKCYIIDKKPILHYEQTQNNL